MGFDFGMADYGTCFKRKNRWLFIIDGVSADNSLSCLPPSRGARPNISFKELEANHLTETIYYPGRPDWKPLTLILYDINRNDKHPIFEWLRLAADFDDNGKVTYKASCDGFKKPIATLELYSGCGDLMERWKYENIWPQSVEFGELDMSSSEVITCDVTLRYDRAYITKD